MDDMGRILIADDEEAFLNAVSAFMRQKGFQCVCAKDSQEVFEYMHSSEFDLLIADIRMPGNEGLQMIQTLPEESQNTPIILVTGYPTLDTAIKAIHSSVVGYLIKPIDFDELIEMTQSAIRLSQIHRAIGKTRQRLDISISDMWSLEQNPDVSSKSKVSANLEDYFLITQENLLHTMHDLMKITRTLSGEAPRQEVCQLMNCPRLEMYKSMLQDTVAELENSKSAFKSKKLEALRKRIIQALERET